MPKDGIPEDRTEDSIDMVTDPDEGDPADLTGAAANETAGQMVGESDAIADEAEEDVANT